jgi:preprotein translocase subunit SecD
MQIESGALPIELEQLEMRTISATLGENALRTSLLAGLVGICCLFIFLIVFYRLSGFVASVALSIYLILVVYVIAIFNVQLTLPGFAGIILGVGMAVDANVIIFERIKEELRLGKTLRTSVESGFKKAFRTIIDANVTTLIVAFVLMYFGTGAIKGFAYTLTIGIIVSVFTALVVTKFLLRCLIALNIKNPKLYTTKYKVKEEA